MLLTPPHLLRVLGHGLLALLYPSRCLGCHRPTDAAGVPGNTLAQQPLCPRCLARLPRPEPEEVAAQLARLGPPAEALDAAFALWRFDKGAVLQTVQHALKYGDRPAYGVALGKVLGEALADAAAAWRLDAVVPVPLHRTRALERGYNQSAQLAEGVSATLALPCRPSLLARPRPTRSQTRLSRTARWQNVAGAFTSPEGEAAGLRLLLLDDVLTTGATATAAAQALRAAGANGVFLATLAFARS